MAIFGSAALSGARLARASAKPSAPHPVAVKCPQRGARALTAKGEEAIGDQLPKMFGETRPIQWIGHYPITRRNPSKPWPQDARPVRIARSPLAPNVPQTDLYVTQAHANSAKFTETLHPTPFSG